MWPLWPYTVIQWTREWTNKTNRKSAVQLLPRNWNTPSWREKKGSLDPGCGAGLELRKLQDSWGPFEVLAEQRRAGGENPGWSCLRAVWSSVGTASVRSHLWGLGLLMTQLLWNHSLCIHLLISNLNKFIHSPRWKLSEWNCFGGTVGFVHLRRSLLLVSYLRWIDFFHIFPWEVMQQNHIVLQVLRELVGK